MRQKRAADNKPAIRSRGRAKRRPRRLRRRWPPPRLTVAQILEWADEFFRQRRRWPHHFDGPIKSAGEETWGKVNDALAHGNRGLPGGLSLARLLYLRRGVRSPRNVPQLNERDILDWAQAHYRQTGSWPAIQSGPVGAAPGETWVAIDIALTRGKRGLPGGSSLAQLLDAHGLKRNPQCLPALTEAQILAAADAFFQQHGYWPYDDSGAIGSLPGDTWCSIEKALYRGKRGLTGGRTLASFLNEHRGILNGKTRRSRRIAEENRLRLEDIVEWGNTYFKKYGIYPHRDSGPVIGLRGLKWSAVDSALKSGSRGLQGGSSLAKLFGSRRDRIRRK